MMDVKLFALLLCNLFLRGQQAHFSSKPPRGIIKARIGEDVTLNWNYTVKNGETLLFMQLFYSKTIQFEIAERIADISMNEVSILPAFQDKANATFTGALTLFNVSAEQRGFYKCSVSLKGKSATPSDTVQLYVGAPPVIYSSPVSHMTVLEDDHVDISCKASGSPVLTVSWYKESPHGWRILTENRLQIKNVKVSDSGKYKCRATNFMRSVEKTVKIAVYERPTVTSFFHTSSLDDTVYECEAIMFTCEARGNNPPVKNIHIYHEGRLVHRSINTDRVNLSGGSKKLLVGGRKTARLRITEVRKEHKGRYYCVAENEYGIGYNKSIDLKVFDAPKNCERKRTLRPTGTTKRQTETFAMPTVSDDDPLPTTNNDVVKGFRSGSSDTRSSLLLIALWTCHLMFCNVFS